MKSALVLFGHGARDPRWAEPFLNLQSRLRAQTEGQMPVELAFLELMSPGLPECIAKLAEQGIGKVMVVPVFFGQGGHLRKDFPVLLDECRAAHPEVELQVSPPVGEWTQVLDSIVAGSLHAVTQMFNTTPNR
jgi:sirohydrochlorin cobaltochelatase